MNVRAHLRRLWRVTRWPALAAALLLLLASLALAQAAPGEGAAAPGGGAAAQPPVPLPAVQIGVGRSERPQDVVASLQILLLLTVLSLAPAILVLTTAFTRIVIVFGFLRSALSTQNMPPNQVLIALALFLTFFIMQPTWSEVNQKALQPYLAGQLTQAQALDQAQAPLKQFMLRFTRQKDLALFMGAARLPAPNSAEDVPFWVVVPSYAISELKTAFQIGFLIFIPFLVIDLVVTTTLLSMGMLFLPPMLISLPFKILLFIMADGWHLVVQQLILSFR